MKKYQTYFTHFKIAGSSIAVLVLAVGFLIGTPGAVNLAESKILNSNNQTQYIPPQGQVAGIAQKAKYNIVSQNITPPQLSAKAAIALDLDTGEILFEKNIYGRMSPASTTKIMTALVAQDYYKSADILTVYPEAQVGGSVMGLNNGERLTFRSLLYGMLLNSGNDAAFTIALNYPGGLNNFVGEMNKKAKDLNLADTNFQNPAGFDNPNHYSSAYDLSQIAKAAIEHPLLSRVVATKETSIVSWDKSKEYNLKNLNQLLSEEGVLGIKTGFTQNAGESFVGLVERKNHKVITVVLNSQDRFAETKLLMDWVYKNYNWVASY